MQTASPTPQKIRLGLIFCLSRKLERQDDSRYSCGEDTQPIIPNRYFRESFGLMRP
jgi:hypothetical protein